MYLTKIERESIITFNELEDNAEFYTCSKKRIKEMDILCVECPDTFKCVSEDEQSKTYSFEKSCVKVQRKRKLSSELKRNLVERFKSKEQG
jgi:hypothetical protein